MAAMGVCGYLCDQREVQLGRRHRIQHEQLITAVFAAAALCRSSDCPQAIPYDVTMHTCL